LVTRSLESNEFIGLTSLDKYHDGKNTEVSYEFLPQWWGAGLATEVIGKLINYAFNDLGLHRLVAETQTANNSSCRLLERVGMTVESKLHKFGAEQSLYSIERHC
jgi:ribosomal-protein-alanine N-acetyltransferase